MHLKEVRYLVWHDSMMFGVTTINANWMSPGWRCSVCATRRQAQQVAGDVETLSYVTEQVRTH